MRLASGWSAPVAATLHSVDALGIPVRAVGIVPVPGPGKIELVVALHADPLIAALLDPPDIPRVPPGARSGNGSPTRDR
jgi:hypothetical protein